MKNGEVENKLTATLKGLNCRSVIEKCTKRAWRLALAKGLIFVIASFAGLLFAEFILDRYLDLPAAVRAILLLVFLAVFVKIFFQMLLLPLRKSVDVNEIARRVESGYPYLEGLFLTAVQLSRPGNPAASHISQALLEKVIDEADELSAQIEPGRLFPSKSLLT